MPPSVVGRWVRVNYALLYHCKLQHKLRCEPTEPPAGGRPAAVKNLT